MPNRTPVRIAEVVRNVNTFVDPSSLPGERYLAGEHVDEDDLRVNRWGLTTDDNFPPTFKRWFEPGHTLLHSRNPKKVVVPDFGGVTGEKLFILEAIAPDVLEPALLPYLL